MFCVWGLGLAASSRKNSAILNFSFMKSPHYVPQGIRWEDPKGVGEGQQFCFLPGFTHFDSRKKIHLLLNQLKFEKTDNAVIKSIHSGLWQNFFSLLAQMVVEQKANKLFNCTFYCRTSSGKCNNGHF